MSGRHGTLSGYTHDACRCAECRAAYARYRKARRQEVRGKVPPGGHGASGYDNYGCRCRICRAGKAVANGTRVAT